MSSDRALSSSLPADVSPRLRHLADSYAKARADRGVDDDHFDVAGARAALAQSSADRDCSSLFERRPNKGTTLYSMAGNGPTLLYLHGGGFVGGAISTHGHIARHLAAALGSPIVFSEYRLAPEHPFPAAFDDAEAALFETIGPVVIAGDSVGGTLALHLALRHSDRTRIRALALLAPMLAFDVETSEYLRTHGRARSMIAHSVSAYDRADPRLNPISQDLSQLPPTLIQIGGADYVKADGVTLATAAARSGAPIVLEHWPNMPHVWHRFAPDAPEAVSSLNRAAAFLSAHADTNQTDPEN